METTFKKSSLLRRTIAVFLSVFLFSFYVGAAVPYTFSNNSAFADANIYVGVVGIQSGAHVWLDCRNSTILPMNSSYNTVTGPTINGNTGPGGNSKYAACFTRLSDIPNKTINLPNIEGCRIFISFNSQLFLYFFGSTGAPSGYAAPNLANATDPNQGIRFEIIELTIGSNGMWSNTTRVDSYQYPMGLEVWGNNAFYKKVGELKSHDQIIAQWKSQAPAAFQVCLDANNVIHFPTKVSAFNKSYFQTYIDQIWSKYSGGDLVFNAGDAGTWRGRVSGNVFTFTRTSDGQVATISNKPSTLEAMEGSGVLAAGGQWDKVVQAQVCAAINRHAIDLNAALGSTQTWSDDSKYYVTDPYNWYCKFWHQADISYNRLTYAFCYDDVFDKSSTINCPSPLRATVTIGGYYGQVVAQSPYAGVIGIPGTVEAENFDNGGEGVSYHDNDASNLAGAYRSTGVDVEACGEGGYNMCWSNNGEWTEYTVNVSTSGSYKIDTRVAAPNATGTFHIEMDGVNVTGTLAVPNTGGWQNWTTVSKVVNLTAGQHIMKYVIDTKEFNTNKFTFTYQPTSGVATFYKDCSYGGTAISLNAGNYTLSQLQAAGILNDDISSLKVNSGYKVILYWDDNFTGTSLTKTASDDCLVDDSWNDKATSLSVQANSVQIAKIEAENYSAMAGVQTETCSEGTLNVGWIEAGDWMAYNSINFPTTGSYTIQYRVASPSGATLSSDLNAGAIQLGNVTIPATGGWQTWTTVSKVVTINAGTYNFGVFAQTAGWNFNWFSITQGVLSPARITAEIASAEENNVEVYPLPLANDLNLKLNGANYSSAKIYDMAGKLVVIKSIDSSNNINSIDVSNLNKGMYFLRLEGENGAISKKLIK